LCLVNGLRRVSNSFFAEPLVEWILGIATTFGTGLFVALLMTVAVVVTYNRVPPASKLRYPALVFALALSSALGAAILTLLESEEVMPLSASALTRDFRVTWPRYALLGAFPAGV